MGCGGNNLKINRKRKQEKLIILQNKGSIKLPERRDLEYRLLATRDPNPVELQPSAVRQRKFAK